MYINKKTYSILYKVALIIIGTFGLLAQFGVFHGSFNASLFHYFTVLSNILCVFYFTGDVLYLYRNRKEAEKTTWLPTLKGISMMSITVTMLVAHFILGSSFSMGSQFGLALLALHYVVPIMTILDWILFDKKGLMKKFSPFLWTSAAVAYFIYAMIAAQIGDGIGFFSRYPYSFMDVDKLGLSRVLVTVGLLWAGFIVLGYVYYGVDRMLFGMKSRKKKSVAKDYLSE